MHVFIVALFTIARTWKQTKCPSIEEWIKTMWYIYVIEYCSAMKRNETGSCVEMWINHIESEVSQKGKSKREKHHMLKHTCGI